MLPLEKYTLRAINSPEQLPFKGKKRSLPKRSVARTIYEPTIRLMFENTEEDTHYGCCDYPVSLTSCTWIIKSRIGRCRCMNSHLKTLCAKKLNAVLVGAPTSRHDAHTNA
jgi:hypothetical protein